MLSSNLSSLSSFQNIRFPDDPPLAGAPHNEGESFLLGPEFGLLQIISSDVSAFCSGQMAGSSKKVLKDITCRFLKDPSLFEQYFETLTAAPNLIYEMGTGFTGARLQGVDPDTAQDIARELRANRTNDFEQFKIALLKGIGRYASYLGQYTKESLGEWLRISAKGGEDSKFAQDALRGLFSSCNSVSEGLSELAQIKVKVNKNLDFLYTFSEAVLASKTPDTQLAGLKMLCFDTDVFSLASPGYSRFQMGAFAWEDAQLQKFFEVCDVILMLARPKFPEAFERYDAAIDGVLAADEFIKMRLDYRKNNPDRFERICEYLAKNTGELPLFQDSPPDWPYNLVVDGSPLRNTLHRAVSSRDESQAPVWIPGIKGQILTTSPISSDLFLHKPAPGDEIVSQADRVETIFYVAPPLGPEASTVLAAGLPALRNQILQNMSRLISPRGDQVTIVNPDLKALGFKWILFEHGAAVQRTGVTVALGNYKFEFSLGEDLVLRDRQQYETFEQLPFNRSAFLEQTILRHLHDLTCTDDVRVNGSKKLLSEDPESGSRFNGRRGHFRNLQSGQRFSAKQAQAAREYLPNLDLEELNERLGRTGDPCEPIGQKTFVKMCEHDPDRKSGPFISSLPRSMDWMNELLMGVVKKASPAS